MERRGSGMKKIIGEYKHFEKLKKLKPYALQLNLQPKRLLAITFNDRRGVITSLTSELAKVL